MPRKAIIILLMMTMLAISCNMVRSKITYKYKNVIIRRVDYDAETQFFFNNTKNGIYTQYPGFNNGFSGVLVFKKNGKVELLSGDGYFRYNTTDTSKFIYRYIIKPEEPKLEDSVCFVSTGIDYEKKINKNSKVQIIYQ